MDETRTGDAVPRHDLSAPLAPADTGVTVYFPGGGHDLVYLQIDGQWVAYEKSVSRTASDFTQGDGPRAKGRQESEREPQVVHWAGYTCHSPYEITREPRRRVYYDPAAHPDLFVTKDGGPPTAPLPVLDLDGSSDPKPWIDPKTGNRFSSDEARTVANLLNYAPRKSAPEDARKSVQGAGPRLRRRRVPQIVG